MQVRYLLIIGWARTDIPFSSLFDIDVDVMSSLKIDIVTYEGRKRTRYVKTRRKNTKFWIYQLS